MTKKISVILGFILICINGVLFAQEEEKKIDCNWFTDTKIWSISVIGEATNYYDFSQFKLGAGVSGMLDMYELKAKVGMYFENHKIHEAAQVSYAPTLFNKLNPGILLQDHCCWDIHDYFEYDLLAGPFVEFRPNSFVTMNFNVLFQQKFSFVYNLPAGNRLVYSCCPAFNLDFHFYPLEWMFIEFTISSYSFYRYFLFLSPDTKLAVNFKANDNLTLEIAGELQAVDFFTMSANFNKLVISVGATWRF